MSHRFILIGVVTLLWALPQARAQSFSRYVLPGTLAQKPVSAAKQIEERALNARWRLGVIRLDPHLVLSDVVYTNNVYDTSEADATSDLRATAGVGISSYLFLGPKTIVNGYALAQYNWWKEQDQLRELNGSFGISLFGLFNRLTVQADAGQVEREQLLSSEAEIPVTVRDSRLGVQFEVEARQRVVIFGSVSSQEQRHSGNAEENVPGLMLSSLDRDSEAVNLGLEYALGRHWRVGLGFEHTETDFLQTSGGRSNTSSGPLIRVRSRWNRLNLDSGAVYRTVDFEGESGSGRSTEEITGNVRLGFQIDDRSSVSLYSGRSILFSAFDDSSFFVGERYGLSAGRQITDRLGLTAFFETGKDSFEEVELGSTGRVDDFEVFGASAGFQLTKRVLATLGFNQSERDSTFDEFDRSRTSLVYTIRVGGNILPW